MASGKETTAKLILKIVSTGQEAFSKVGDALKELGKIAVAVFGTISGIAGTAIAAYKESEAATNALNQSLISQGIYSKELSKKYQDMASDLQKVTTFEDDSIVKAQAKLQQYLGTTEITKELTKATLDFASAQGIDLDSAVEKVGKSIGTNTNALGRHGIAVDENALKTTKLEQVTKGLELRFGGQAEAAGKGLGSLTQMKNAVGNLFEVMGEKLAPVVTYAAKAFAKFAIELQENKEVIVGFSQASKLVAQAGVFIKNVFIGVGEVIGTVFGTLIGAAVQVANLQFKEAWETIKTGFNGSIENVQARYEQYQEDIDQIDSIFLASKQEKSKQEEDMVRRSNQAKLDHDKNFILTQEQMFAARDEKEINKLLSQEQLKSNEKLRSLNQQIHDETNYTKKLELEQQKRKFLDEQYRDLEVERLTGVKYLQARLEDEKVRKVETSLGDLSQLQNSKSKELVMIGKAAALAQIAINTAQGAVGAYAAFATPALGPVGPPLGFVAAGALVAYGAERSSQVAGINLAEGGIIKATPGGVPAVIGEGGRDEMVVPLDSGYQLGTTINMQVFGGFLGNESQAKEFALVLDKELLKLRQGNESLAFDSGVI